MSDTALKEVGVVGHEQPVLRKEIADLRDDVIKYRMKRVGSPSCAAGVVISTSHIAGWSPYVSGRRACYSMLKRRIYWA